MTLSDLKRLHIHREISMRFTTFLLMIPLLFSCSEKANDPYIHTDWRDAVIDQKNFIYSGIGYIENRPQSYTEPAGNTFYIDPVNGSPEGDGSVTHPWLTLQQVIEDGLIQSYNRPASDPSRSPVNPGAPVHAGDLIILREGNHGIVSMTDRYNGSMITIRAATNERPLIRYARLVSCGNWRFDGLYITMEMNLDEFEDESLFAVYSYNSRTSTNIELYNSKIYSMWDSSGWNIYDWNFTCLNGVNISGRNIIIENNFLQNINFGISITGDNNIVLNNTVSNFAGDGMRGNGNDLLFEANFVKNCYAVNMNHDDGFQSFCVNGPVEWYRVTLRRNVILNYEDPGQPFRGSLQGIGCFDGFYRDWVIENNLIIVDHWHGLSLYGTTGTVIRNNIVVDINSERPGPPHILITGHKDGRTSSGCSVTGNIANNITLSGTSITESGNTVISISELNSLFIDPDNNDFRLNDDSILQ